MKGMTKMMMTQRAMDPENRRDSRGRYAPRNEMDDRYDGGYNRMPERSYPTGNYESNYRMGHDGGWVVKPIDDRMDGNYGPENRRDSRGRYAPRNESHESWMPPYWENRMDGGQYQMDRNRGRQNGYDRSMENRLPPVYENDMGYRYGRAGYRQDNDGGRMIGFYGGEMGGDFPMDVPYDHRDELAHYRSQKQSGYASSTVMPIDRKTANEWVKRMKNADGSTGEHWTFDQTSQVMKQRNIDCEPAEFYAAMNMLWSDYGPVAKKFGIDTVEYWSELAKAFLLDKDVVGDKLALYYECIVKK